MTGTRPEFYIYRITQGALEYVDQHTAGTSVESAKRMIADTYLPDSRPGETYVLVSTFTGKVVAHLDVWVEKKLVLR